MSDITQLIDNLVGIVREFPGRSARELASITTGTMASLVTRRDINSILYSNKARFEHDSSYVPKWFHRESFHSDSRKTHFPIQKDGYGSLYPWQREALFAWEQSGYNGVIEAVTGAGKTRVGIAAAKQVYTNGGNVIVIVPTTELMYQWDEKLRSDIPKAKIGLFGNGERSDFRSSDIIVAIVNSVRTHRLRTYRPNSLLIADECHRYGSECNQGALKKEFVRRLGLTATYEREDNGVEEWLSPFFKEVVFSLDYRRAIRDRVIADFSIALIGVQFDEDERLKYEELSKRLRKAKSNLLKQNRLSEEPIGVFLKEVALLSEKGSWDARIYMSAFTKRKALLAETRAKEDGVRKLRIAIHKASRVIVFTQTIESTDQINSVLTGTGIESETIHSKLPKKLRKEIFKRFDEGKLKVIVAPKVLDEGIDVPEVDLGIIVANSQVRRQMIQRLGRVLRKKEDGRLARLAFL